jgi:predicted permease
MIESLLRDLRIAVRSLSRSPGFAAVAIVTLALGISATTTVFSVVYGVLFRPLPFPNADRLVQIVQLLPRRGAETSPARAGLTLAQIAEWQATSRTLSGIGYATETRVALTDVSTPVLLLGAQVSVGLFRALGVDPMLGRMFLDADAQQGSTDVVILGYRTWRRHFGSDPQVVDKAVVLNDRRHRVIGVMPDGFDFPSLATSASMSLDSEGRLDSNPEFWIPFAALPRASGPAAPKAGLTFVQTFALVRPGSTIEQAAAEARTLMPARTDGRYPIELVSARVEQGRIIRPVLLLFQTGVAFVLFIACANVVNLLLARAGHRRHDLAVRRSLGASRTQLARYAAAEGVVLATVAGGIGILLTFLMVTLFRQLPPYLLPRMNEIRVDGSVLVFTFALSLCSGAAVGLFAAARVLRGDRAGWLRPSGESAVTVSRRQRPSRLLVIAEIAVGVVLLAGASLLLTSVVRLTSVDPGFQPSGLLTFRVGLPPARYPNAEAQHAFYDELSAAVRGIEGVESVAAANTGGIAFDLSVGGRGQPDAIVQYRVVTPQYFSTLRARLTGGRDLTVADRATRANVAIVNETFVRRFISGHPVGQRMQFYEWPDLTIVGVVRDTMSTRIDDPIWPAVYLPQETGSLTFGAPTYVVRTAGDPRALVKPVRETVRRLDNRLVVSEATTVDALLERGFTSSRVYGATSAGLAIVAVMLAVVGLYGVLAYSVGSRTREIGIRIALGAQSRAIVASVVRDGMAMVAAGVVIGIAGAVYLSRFLEALLFGVTPHDVTTLAGAAAAFIAVATVACYFPSKHAVQVDPVAALRSE